MLAVSNLTSLTSLNLSLCFDLTDAGKLLPVSSLPALTSLDLGGCVKVTGAGLRAVSASILNNWGQFYPPKPTARASSL
jgi:hypothetical protein